MSGRPNYLRQKIAIARQRMNYLVNQNNGELLQLSNGL
jgi:hypothetical protein